MNSIKKILIIPRKKEVAPRKVSLSPQNIVYFKRKKNLPTYSRVNKNNQNHKTLTFSRTPQN